MTRAAGRLVALGDSFSCGEGVGTTIDRASTWVALLARGLGYELDVLAMPGASVAEVSRQLDGVRPQRGEIATLLVGLNDIVRAGFDLEQIRQDLARLVAELAATHDTVLVGRWHDPTELRPVPVPVPARLRDRMAARMHQVNDTITAAAALHGALLFDLDAIPQLRRREAWAVDRVHPSCYGHQAIAAAAASALAEVGYVIPVGPELPPSPVRRIDECRWLVAHGGPWLVKRLRRVALPVATLAVRGGDGAALAQLEPADGGLMAGAHQLGGQRAVARAGGQPGQ
jgi:lysophospholipase L1-like esterase